MTANQIVLQVIRALETADIPYMLVGSYSSNAFGVPRSTQDADFIIEPGDRSISAVAALIGPDIKLDPQLIFESVTLTSRYIATHEPSGFRIELFLRPDDEFQRSRFSRRVQKLFEDRLIWIPTAEDVIVQKLRWFARIKRSKDWDDIRHVAAVQQSRLDLPYIRHWCDQHGTRELFEKLLKEAEEIQPEQES